MKRITMMQQGDWWVVVLRGVVALILGLLAFINIQATVMALFIWLGAYAILDGGLQVYAAIYQRRSGEPIWPGLLTGIASILVGIIIFAWPNLTAVVLLALIAVKAIVQGIADTYQAFQMREGLSTVMMVLLIVIGLAQLIFGIWMIFQPVFVGLTLVMVIAIYAVFVGTILVLSGLWMRFGSGGGVGPTATA
jgi:uncharacterized membrane protein HdeD (DUF308 family)